MKKQKYFSALADVKNYEQKCIIYYLFWNTCSVKSDRSVLIFADIVEVALLFC